MVFISHKLNLRVCEWNVTERALTSEDLFSLLLPLRRDPVC